MTYRPQWQRASSEKNRIPGLHSAQAARALKIALLGAQGEHEPRGALEELDQWTLLLRPLGVLCASHAQAIPRPYGGIDKRL